MPADTKTLHIPASFESLDASRFRRLDEVTIGVFDCPHSTPKLSDHGPIVVRTQDIMTGVLRVEQAPQVSEETYRERINRAEPEFGDLLYSREGTYFAIAAEVPSGTRLCLGQRMVLIRPDRTKVYTRYLKYWLNSPQIAAYIHGFRDGSVAERLNLPVIRGLPVFLPELNEQQTISETLGALDDKIEQNRRTSRALEKLARATFKAWFVDFEPVRAKAAGATSFPGMPPAAFAALPTRLIDSKLGPIPEGWIVGKLRDLLTERGERMTPGEETRQLPYVPIDCITPRQVTLETYKKGEEAQSSLIRFCKGDILFGAMRPYFHKVCLAPFEGTTRTTCFVLVPHKDNDRSYALMLTSEKTTVQFATTHSVGSTIPYAKWQSSLSDMPFVLPSANLRAVFGEFADPLFQHCNLTFRESARLAKLRDYLLPRLLSGRVRVHEHGKELA